MIKSIKRLFPLLALLVTATFFTGCKKYEEGPTISLQTRDERVSNVWKIEEYTQNGNVVALDANALAMRYEFTKDRVYTLYTSGNMETAQVGSWVFKNDNETLGLSNNIDFFTETFVLGNGDYKITRLAEDELWLKRESDMHGSEEVKLQPE